MTQGGKNLNEVSWIHHSEGFRSEILHRLIDGKHPIICRLSTLLSTISDVGFRNHPELLPKKKLPEMCHQGPVGIFKYDGTTWNVGHPHRQSTKMMGS